MTPSEEPAAAADLAIVVPILNEAATVDEFYARVERLGLAAALIFVDNASTDGTLACLARHPGVRVVRHDRNRGYGASVRDGIAASTAEKIVIIDADLEYPPEAIPRLLDALDRSPVVYCSRFRGAQPPAMPWLRRLGNRLVSGLYNRLYGQRTTDLYTGMKGLRRSALPLAELRMDGFEHGAELAALIAASGCRIDEIAVDYTPRQRGHSKMRHLPEAAKLVFWVLVYKARAPKARATTSPSPPRRGPG